MGPRRIRLHRLHASAPLMHLSDSWCSTRADPPHLLGCRLGLGGSRLLRGGGLLGGGLGSLDTRGAWTRSEGSDHAHACSHPSVRQGTQGLLAHASPPVPQLRCLPSAQASLLTFLGAAFLVAVVFFTCNTGQTKQGACFVLQQKLASGQGRPRQYGA